MKISSLVWMLVFAALILGVTSTYFEVFRLSHPPTGDVDLWLQGNPPRPFATRVLVPGIVFGASGIVPEAVRKSVDAGTLRLPIPSLPARLEYQVLGLLVLVCFTGYTIVMRRLVRASLAVEDLPANLITALSLLLMPVTFTYHNYFYDPSTLCLSALLWYLMYRERWTAFFLVFLVACVNKETALVFVIPLVLWRSYRKGAQPSVRYIALVGCAGLVIRGAISLLCSRFPGTSMQFHLFTHNLVQFEFVDVPGFASTILIGFLLLSFWQEKPELIRIGSMHLAILVTLALFSGFLDEYRAFLDCYPIIVLSMAYSLMRLGGKVGFPTIALNRSSSAGKEVREVTAAAMSNLPEA